MLWMSRRHRRAFALVWAVLQFALPTVGMLAEAATASAAVSSELSGHVEDRSGPGCRPVHAPDCARCQALSTHPAAAPAPQVDWASVECSGAHATAVTGQRTLARSALPLSRAPPPVS